MNAYKLALIMAAHFALDGVAKVVEVVTPENQAQLTPIITGMLTQVSEILDLVQNAPTPPTPPTPTERRPAR